MSGTIKAEVLRGPFDRDGQPDTRTGQSMLAWDVRGGLPATRAVLGYDRAAAVTRVAHRVHFPKGNWDLYR